MPEDALDWAALLDAARAAARHAYAPYSGYPVGAAGRTEDGRILAGCNVENASYGLTLCAECSLVSALAMSGGGRLTAVVAVDGAGAPIPPCGRCRQLLDEHAVRGMRVLLAEGAVPIETLLPAAFGPGHLDDALGPAE